MTQDELIKRVDEIRIDDPHTTMARKAFGLQDKEVTYTQRKAGKTINYALLFGMSSSGIANLPAVKLALKKSN